MEQNNKNQTAAEQGGKRRGFMFYFDWSDNIISLSPKNRLAVFEAIVQYAATGEVPHLSRMANLAFQFIQADLERSREYFEQIREKRRKAINKRWHKEDDKDKDDVKNQQDNTNVSFVSVCNANHNDNHNDIHNHNDKVGSNNNATDHRLKTFTESLRPYVETYGKDMLNAFFDYWTEPTKDGQRMRYELQDTWSLPHRLRAWARREVKMQRSNGKGEPTPEQVEQAERERRWQQMAAKRQAAEEAERERSRQGAVSRDEYERMKREGLI